MQALTLLCAFCVVMVRSGAETFNTKPIQHWLETQKEVGSAGRIQSKSENINKDTYGKSPKLVESKVNIYHRGLLEFRERNSLKSVKRLPTGKHSILYFDGNTVSSWPWKILHRYDSDHNIMNKLSENEMMGWTVLDKGQSKDMYPAGSFQTSSVIIPASSELSSFVVPVSSSHHSSLKVYSGLGNVDEIRADRRNYRANLERAKDLIHSHRRTDAKVNCMSFKH